MCIINKQVRYLPLLSESQMANVASFDAKMFSNSVKLMAKLSQMLLNPPCNSLILANDRFIKGQFVFKSLISFTYDRKLPILILIL